MEYQIKIIKNIKDVDMVAGIVNEVLKDDFPIYKLKTRLMYRKKIYNNEYFYKIFKNQDNVILGCFKDSQLIAFIALKKEAGGAAFIEWLAVTKTYRGIGIGLALLQAAESWALKHLIHYLHLYTEMPNNITYYKKRGFKLVGTHKNSWFGEDENIMAKSLRDKPFEEIFKIKK